MKIPSKILFFQRSLFISGGPGQSEKKGYVPHCMEIQFRGGLKRIKKEMVIRIREIEIR